MAAFFRAYIGLYAECGTIYKKNENKNPLIFLRLMEKVKKSEKKWKKGVDSGARIGLYSASLKRTTHRHQGKQDNRPSQQS